MANFQPLKHRLLMILQDNLQLFDTHGRFVDYQFVAGLLRRDCIVQQVFRKTAIET